MLLDGQLDSLRIGKNGFVRPYVRRPKLNKRTLEVIDRLQSLISSFLTYRLRQRKVHTRTPGCTPTTPFFAAKDFGALYEERRALEAAGLELSCDVELPAFLAQTELSLMRSSGYFDTAAMRGLPLRVASIAGPSASLRNRERAHPGKPRDVDRRSTLAIEVAQQRRWHPDATALEVLHRLCGGDVVKAFRNGRVYYWDAQNKEASVTLARFETIFSEQSE